MSLTVICLRRDICPADKLWISICHCERKTGDPTGTQYPVGSPCFHGFSTSAEKAHIGIKNRECVVCFSFDQSIAASDNRLSYACILLFPASTQYPAGSPFFTDFQVLEKTQKGANYRFLIASTGFFRAILSTGIKLAKSAVAMQPRRIIPISRIP